MYYYIWSNGNYYGPHFWGSATAVGSPYAYARGWYCTTV
jgi:hypothetical protein